MTEYKKGEEIKILKCRNGNTGINGKVGIVTQNTSGIVNVKIGQQVYSLYQTAPADDFCRNTKEEILKYYNEQKKSLLKDIEDIDRELEFYTKYNSEEEYVADKLLQIMKTKDKDKLSKMLKELRTSNYL